MKNVYIGTKIVFGVQEPKPIARAPEGRYRLRMRNTTIARLFVKTRDGIRKFVLEDKGNFWLAHPNLEQGANLRRLKCRAYLPGANIAKIFQINPNILTR